MTTSRKILFTDMDGTLLDDKKEISDSVRKAIKKLVDDGHYLVLSSGRPIGSILETRQRLGLDVAGSFIIGFNGSLTYSCDTNSPVFEHTVPLKDLRIVMEEAHRLGIHCQTYEHGDIIVEAENEELAFYKKNIHIPHRVVGDIISYMTIPPYKLLATHLSDRSKLEQLSENVLARTDGDILPTFSNDNYLEFYSKDSGKGTALRELSAYLNVPIENCAAIGDEFNDISMIEAAGLGCAMANGRDEVKKAAAFITTRDNNHDGILDLIDYFFC
ncbi:MAG: HAD family phosphatase [Lachnospiraceae bacterium]|nr:HAD family phosphatase [Candidatus Merdinaster equi]